MKGKKERFYKQISSNRMTRENVGNLLSGISQIMIIDMEKFEVLKAPFPLVFISRTIVQ